MIITVPFKISRIHFLVTYFQKYSKGENIVERHFHCPVEAAFSLIGGKYKAIILWHLLGQTLRFSELQRLIPQAAPKMLTQQLRELETDGLLIRTVYPVIPPKTEYRLSELGETLRPVLESICTWGRTYAYPTPTSKTNH